MRTYSLSSKHRQIETITQSNTNNSSKNNERTEQKKTEPRTLNRKKVEAPKKWTSDTKKELNKYHHC